MAIFYPSYFSFSTFKGLLIQISVYGIVACAMTIAIIGGEFDLSVGSILPFSTLLFAYLMPRIGIFASIVPVSYTHLDVYKRQPIYRRCASGIGLGNTK